MVAKSVRHFIICLGLLLGLNFVLISQAEAVQTWIDVVDDTKLTSSAPRDDEPSLGVDNDGNSHIVWSNSDEIYYTKVDNAGNTVVEDLQITSSSNSKYEAILSVDNSGNVHAMYYLDESGSSYNELYYTKLDNNGNTVVEDTRITSGNNWSWEGKDMQVDNSGNVHIVRVDGDYEILYTKLDNSGNVVVEDSLVSTASWPTGLSTDVDNSGNVHVAWVYNYSELHYAKLDNSGNVLVADKTLTPVSDVWTTDIAVDNNGNVHVTFQDEDSNAKNNIYYMKLDNNGNTLVGVSQVAFDMEGFFPDIAVDIAGNVHIAWEHDVSSSVYETYYTKLDNNGLTLVDDTSLTSGSGAKVAFPSIGVDASGNVHVVWDDYSDSELYYTQGAIVADCGSLIVDCNDDDAGINPAACDIKKNGIDEDCDGVDRKSGPPCQ